MFQQEMVDGLDFMHKYSLGFLRSIGHYFSWHCVNEKGEDIFSRIDQCLGNDLWFEEFPNV